MKKNLIRLEEKNGTWRDLYADWKSQCEQFNEDFSLYENEPFDVIRDLTKEPLNQKAAAFALHYDKEYAAIFQVNQTCLPGFEGEVLRVRMISLSPYYEFGPAKIEEYGELLIKIFLGIIEISDTIMRSKHIKFHLRSPADRQFFFYLGQGLNSKGIFTKVDTIGSWVYITK